MARIWLALRRAVVVDKIGFWSESSDCRGDPLDNVFVVCEINRRPIVGDLLGGVCRDFAMVGALRFGAFFLARWL